MPIINPPRSKKPTGPWSEKDLIWGISRRAGYSDTDDPKTHTGVTQHAFELGQDARAICGYGPPQRRSLVGLEPRPQLAVPGPDNPRCPKCSALIMRQAVSETPAPRVGVLEAIAEEAAQYEAVAPTLPETTSDRPLQLGWDAPPPEYAHEEPKTERAAPQRRPRARLRRRSVRRGGTRTIAAARRSLTIRITGQVDGAGVVAHLLDAPDDVRVSSVSFKADGIARINLNKPASVPVTVTWFIVSTLEG